MNFNETLKFFGNVNKSVYGVNPYKVDSIEGLSGHEERMAVRELNKDDDHYKCNVIDPWMEQAVDREWESSQANKD